MAWFARLGLNVSPPMGLRCANIATAISAALQGSGVALVRSLLARDALGQGRLVRVLPEMWDMPSTKVHLVCARGRCAGEGVRGLAGRDGGRIRAAYLSRVRDFRFPAGYNFFGANDGAWPIRR